MLGATKSEFALGQDTLGLRLKIAPLLEHEREELPLARGFAYISTAMW